MRVLVVDERRLLAAGLAHVLDEHPATRGTQSLQDLTALPVALASGWDVVVCSQTFAHHVLRVCTSGTRVLVVVHDESPAAVAALLQAGAAGICTGDDTPDEVARAVVQVADQEMRLPQRMLPAVLVALQQQRCRANEADEVLARLTERERRVLFGLGQGRGRSEIADDLGLSPHTVRTHVQHVLAKLSLHSQLEAAALARELLGVLDPSVSVIDLTRRHGLGAVPGEVTRTT